MNNQNNNQNNQNNMTDCGCGSKNGNMTDCGCGSSKEKNCKSGKNNADSAKMANKDSGNAMPKGNGGMSDCGCNSYNNENACE
ncbi:MAG: hypothetical protein R3Y65_03575 [Bacillota bacterium]